MASKPAIQATRMTSPSATCAGHSARIRCRSHFQSTNCPPSQENTMRHSASPRYSILLSLVVLLGSSATLAWGQSPTAAPAPAPAVKSVDISSAQKDYEVGQHVQFNAVAKDESGNPLTEKPSAWFAAPFDLAAVDDNGTVTFFQPGEVMIGALVAGKPGFSKVIVKPA